MLRTILKYSLASFLTLLLFFLFSCKEKKNETLFELVENSGISFLNKVENTKQFNIFSYRNFYNGGGVAIGDINNDSLPDVLMTSNTGVNKLFLNKGNFKFEDISAKAGIEQLGKWNTGVVMADVNSDGWLDIYICNAGYSKWKNKEGNALFINNHDLTFTDKAKEYGLDEKGYTTHAAFFDYDLDGDLDCYILNNSFIPVNTLNYSNKRELRAVDWPVEDFAKGGGDKLLKNENGKFIDVSAETNIYGSLIGFGLGVTVGDVNGDHYPDLYISNDFFERDYLYINQRNGTFKEELEQWIEHTSLASMGADLADVNNDGYPDIFTTDMLPDDEYRLKTTSSFDNIDVYQLKLKQGFYHQFQQNALQVNNRNGKFMETAHFSGVSATDWSWGALIFDADNDGLNDLYVCNGIYKDVIDQDFIDFFANDIIQKMVTTGEKEEVQKIIDSMPSVPVLNKAYRNNSNLKFSDEGLNWGFAQLSFSNGAAYGDLDNDGDLDMVVNNVNMPSFVYKNNSREISSNNYIGIQLKGKGANTYAIGSLIKIYCGNEIISREVIPSRGFQSSTDYKIIAGLGNKIVDSLLIEWPNKTVTKIQKPGINKTHNIQQTGNESFINDELLNKPQPIFENAITVFDKHTEDDFIDFYAERNVPVMLSKEGPNAATADVNKDGLMDIFIGGAKGQPGQLYLQTKNGFVKKQQGSFINDKPYEDVALSFFDCDNDGDEDLFIGAGGNNKTPRHRYLQHRLYRNNGKGDFTNDSTAFPVNFSNISVAIPMDYDSDGDLDLFVGGRNMSYSYGMDPYSYIYENNGKGKFTDVTEKLNAKILRIGMVTDAAWADVTGDKKNDLVITGEWMAPYVFTYTNGKFQETKTNLAHLSGWWQSIAIADMDGDGDNDMVLGNYGDNFYLRPDSANPVKLWVNDFDVNGIPDKVLSRTSKGKDITVFLKKDFTDAMPALKKENLKHHDFASKTIQTLFKPELLNTTTIKTFNYSKSVVAYNEGNGNYTIKELPLPAQLSSINAIVCNDINKDGKTDLILGGNITDCLPQFGRLDANYGLVLINKGKGIFEEMPSSQTGISLKGMVRDIKIIPGDNSNYLLFLRNDDYPAMYKFR
ncbi:MAG: CRTAC1 family protein [Bacteroidetes bacterium]|nr:MAG: CRTAC1 family protein [Bacteroidota bacterium]